MLSTSLSIETAHGSSNFEEFVKIIQRHRSSLLSLAWRITSRREEAEDIVQDALLKAFRALPRFRGDSRMDTWLHTIVRNRALESLRNRARKPELSFEPYQGENDFFPTREFPDFRATPEESCEQKEQQRLLRSAMRDLTPVTRSAIEMCILQELPHRVVARELNVNVATVKTRVFNGKRLLKRAIDRRTCHPIASQEDNRCSVRHKTSPFLKGRSNCEWSLHKGID